MEQPHQYRKKPIVITAQRFNPQADVWPAQVKPWPGPNGEQPRDMSWGYIETLEGRMSVQAGDWIIVGVVGEAGVTTDDVFRATYEML